MHIIREISYIAWGKTGSENRTGSKGAGEDSISCEI